jgi:hypothetical protein
MTGAGALCALFVLTICVIAQSGNVLSATPTAATPVPTQAIQPSAGAEAPETVPVSLRIENHSREDERLLSASTPVAQCVEIHSTTLERGVRVMKPSPAGLAIPANSSLLLEQGTTHLMLFGLREPLIQGRTFPLTLRFARGGEVTVTVRVRRKVDAAGLPPVPPVVTGDLTLSSASAPPAAVHQPLPSTSSLRPSPIAL